MAMNCQKITCTTESLNVAEQEECETGVYTVHSDCYQMEETITKKILNLLIAATSSSKILKMHCVLTHHTKNVDAERMNLTQVETSSTVNNTPDFL